VPLLRVAERLQTGQTIGRMLAFELRMLALVNGCKEIRISDPHVPTKLHAGLSHDGYSREPDGAWKAYALRACGSASILELLPPDHDLVGILQAIGTKPSNAELGQALLVEKWLWPAKVFDAGLQNYLVPIRPRWAAGLLGYPHTLLSRRIDLGLAREHVYYKSPSGTLETPSRIGWYVSGSGRERVGGIVAFSHLVECETGAPDELYRKNRRLGVYSLADVRGSARAGLVQALRFEDTELLDAPIVLPTMRALAGPRQIGTLQSTTRVDTSYFEALYKEGVGVADR
jgi:hypothetical protein